MLLARYRSATGEALGTVAGDAVTEVLHSRDAAGADLLVAYLQGARSEPAEHALRSVRLLAPLTRPGKILCVGLNYRDHCRETGSPVPDHPILFSKFANSIAGPGEPVRVPGSLTQRVDFEVELAAVIGKSGRRISQAEALSHVFGYTIANDVSARDLQFLDTQWLWGKSLDTFCPLGPWVATADEVGDPQSLRLSCSVNGIVYQDSSTSEMIFGVAELISYISQGITLEPGDLVLTGTPFGVGFARNPEVYLQDRDVVGMAIERIGAMENPVHVEA